jgi:citrate/tricarballylate utilization protein
VATALTLAAIAMAMLLAGALAGGASAWPANPRGEFYAVIPHHVMVGLFGGVCLFALAALAVGGVRFWRDAGPARARLRPSAVARALRDAATLRHLHTSGVDCTHDEEARAPWRRWCHHLTLYGFLLCFASTSVAAVYHLVFGWEAPYAVTSLPVVLGTAGGAGLLAGPAGLLALARRRDPALADPAQAGPDAAFIALLFLTSLTGLLLLVLRNSPAMTCLLAAHLGFVLALFVTLPYGKFVHGIYRTLALVRNAGEE